MVNVVMTALVYLLTMVMSYILKRAGLFHKEDKKVLSNLIFYYSASFFNKQLRWGRSKCILCNSDTAGISG